jgi:hypothetical protein
LQPQALTFDTPGRPESVVATPDGFCVGQLQPVGTVLKYSLEGEKLNFTSPELVNTRGLALNEASDTLWAAVDEAVVDMLLGETEACFHLECHPEWSLFITR